MTKGGKQIRVPSSYRRQKRLKGCWNCKHCHDASTSDILGRHCLKYCSKKQFDYQDRLSVDRDGNGICDKHEKRTPQ